MKCGKGVGLTFRPSCESIMWWVSDLDGMDEESCAEFKNVVRKNLGRTVFEIVAKS